MSVWAYSTRTGDGWLVTASSGYWAGNVPESVLQQWAQDMPQVIYYYA
jgi:hypothetical protein